MAKAKKKFNYKRRDKSAIEARAQKTSSRFAALVTGPIKLMKMEERDYCVRILPATWKDPEHFGYDVAYNRNIGPDKDRYISRSFHGHDDDPIRDYINELKAEGRKKDVKEHDLSERVFYYAIDRDNEGAGVQLMDFPQTADKELAKVCKDRRTGATLYIDDPEEGRDVYFTREKNKGGFLENVRFEVTKDACPIFDDQRKYEAVEELVCENPIPDVLNILPAEDLQRLVDAMKMANPTTRAEDDDKTPPPRTRSRARRPEPEPEPEQEPIDDEDADLDEPAPKAGGLRKGRRRREPLPEVEDDDIPF